MLLQSRHRAISLGVALWGGICLAQDAAPTPPAASAQTQAPPAQAEMSTHDAPATFSTRVFLVQVPVVVRDKLGHAVGTLHKEDFQLFDKGKPQIISRFAVEKAGTSSIPAVKAVDVNLPDQDQGEAPIPQRFIAYLFDDVHL